MTQKIALVQMPIWDINSPSLALATVASALKMKRVELKCFDFNLMISKKYKREIIKNITFLQVDFLKVLFPEYFPPLDERLKDFVYETDKFLNLCLDEILLFKPDIVAFSVSTYSMQALCLFLAKKIKESSPKIRIVFGGLIYAKKLNNLLPIKTGFVDEIIQKGEEAEFFNRFEDKTDYNLDPDIVYFDFFDLKKYGKKRLPMIWTEGCNMNCKFCLHPLIKEFHNPLDADKTIKRIKFYIKKYGIRKFRLGDSNLNQNVYFLSKICDKIIDQKLDISWDSHFYIYPSIKISLLKKMAKAGCKCVWVGVESGSQKILDELNKNFTVDIAKDVIKKLHKSGIKVGIFIIVGSSSESHKDYLETLKLLYELRKYTHSLVRGAKRLQYQAGSQFYLEARANKLFNVTLPDRLKIFEEYLPYVYYPKPGFDKSTITDYSYLIAITQDIFLESKRRKLSLVVDDMLYNKNGSTNLSEDGSGGYKYFKLPWDIEKFDSFAKTRKDNIKALLDINYIHYLNGDQKQIADGLNKLAELGIRFELCRPIPRCFMHKVRVTKKNLTLACKECNAYLYLNKNEKMVYCKGKFWNYYSDKDKRIRDACRSCLHRRRDQCKMYCIQYFANEYT